MRLGLVDDLIELLVAESRVDHPVEHFVTEVPFPELHVVCRVRRTRFVCLQQIFAREERGICQIRRILFATARERTRSQVDVGRSECDGFTVVTGDHFHLSRGILGEGRGVSLFLRPLAATFRQWLHGRGCRLGRGRCLFRRGRNSLIRETDSRHFDRYFFETRKGLLGTGCTATSQDEDGRHGHQ